MNLNESSESFQSFSSALDSFEIASVETCLKNNTIFDSKLHKEYLRFHLTEKLITNEFQFTFIDTAASLTTVKIGNNLNKIYLKTDVRNTQILAPITFQIYNSFVLNFPLFKGTSIYKDYLGKIIYHLVFSMVLLLDFWLQNHFLDIGKEWMIATKFDILKFVSVYLNLILFLRKEALSVKFPCSDRVYGSEKNTLLKTVFFSEVGRFRRNYNKFKNNLNHIAEKEAKFLNFCGVIENWVYYTNSITKELSTEASTLLISEGEVLFENVKKCATIADLPRNYQDWVEGTVCLWATLIDNILDDFFWRKKMFAIVNKFPLSLVLTTMRFVNPIPFVEKCLSFFLWGPLGVNSLLQRFGAMVTDHDKTIAKLAIEREKLGSLAIPIEEYINKSFSNRCSLNEESTNQDLLAFFSDSNIPHLIESYNARNSTHRKFKIENCFSLVKLHLRVKEKEKFISALGSPNIIKLITLISKIFPPLLSEIYSVSNFHDVFQQFFKTLSEILEILEFDYSKKKSDWKTTIEKIKCPIRMFFNIFYDIIYKISHKNPTGENGFHSLVEWFIKLMLNFSQLHSSATFSTCVPNIENQTTSNCVLEKIFSSLSNEEKKNLEQELNYLILKKEYVGNMKDHENNDLNFIEGKFLDLWFENVINKSS
ncbi:hypothetical protein HDU92_008210 [Lobulomyces angularis]|nr:hypothetical protein HDU92_008210 [Lobulomyces angularis]